MSLEDDIMVLSQIGFFAGVTDDQLRLLAFGGEKEQFPAGATLFLKGEKSDCSYVIMDGVIDLVEKPEDGDNILATIGMGGLVGELALVTDILRPNSAIARTDSKLLRLTRKLFTRMLEEYPELAYDFHQKISRSLNSTVIQLDKVRSDMDISDQ